MNLRINYFYFLEYYDRIKLIKLITDEPLNSASLMKMLFMISYNASKQVKRGKKRELRSRRKF